MTKICGIYKITHRVNGRVYIGRSIDIHKRFKKHLTELKNGTHHNIEMLLDYSEGNFDVDIVEYCEPEQVNLKEMEHIMKYSQEILYNYIGTKEKLKFALIERCKLFSLIPDIDYLDPECISTKGKVLSWNMHISVNEFEYFIYILSSDHDEENKDGKQSRENIRSEFIKSSDNRCMFMYSYSDKKEVDVLNDMEVISTHMESWYRSKGIEFWL